jgi:hypothetical protein
MVSNPFRVARTGESTSARYTSKTWRWRTPSLYPEDLYDESQEYVPNTMTDSTENEIEGIEVECHNCGYTWDYKGMTWTTPCPNCDFQTETGVGPDD